MLKSLQINNIALIEECEIEFSAGLNVLSGETGAGKSVVLESINFVLGQKADKAMILHGATSCSASCVFDISSATEVKALLEEMEIDFDDEIVIKRVFKEDGKGSIKINGENITASMLKKITGLLVDVHGQSEHFALLKESNQLKLIDSLNKAEISAKKAEIAEIINDINLVNSDKEKLGGSNEDRAKRLDYLSYATNEIESANLIVGEEEALLERRKILQNREKIFNALNVVNEYLDGENACLDILTSAYRQLISIASYSDKYEKMADSVDGCIALLNEIKADVNNELFDEYSSAEADEIEKRLQLISSLKLKYGKTIEEINDYLEKAKGEIQLILTSESSLKKLNEQENKLLDELDKKYKELTLIRKKLASEFSEKLILSLRELAMPKATFSVTFESEYERGKLSASGIDKIVFMFSANLGEPLKPLSFVISGGELSRLMLAIKTVCEQDDYAFSYIFDEIDAGISGVTAQIVAENFAKIARTRQIIAISHLPQIVAMSDCSLLITKKEQDKKTRTEVKSLSASEKEKEILRLIAGTQVTESAKAHAVDMIASCERFKKSI